MFYIMEYMFGGLSATKWKSYIIAIEYFVSFES